LRACGATLSTNGVSFWISTNRVPSWISTNGGFSESPIPHCQPTLPFALSVAKRSRREGASTPRLRRYAQHERGFLLDQHEQGFLRIPVPLHRPPTLPFALSVAKRSRRGASTPLLRHHTQHSRGFLLDRHD